MTQGKPSRRYESTLPRELDVFCRNGQPQIVVVRAREGPERFTLTTSVLRAIPSPGVVIATASGAGAYREFLKAGTGSPHGNWKVLEGANSDGGIRAIAQALSKADALIVEPNREESVSALWLPAHIVEAFSLLPADGDGIVVIDSWDGLLAEYLPAEGDRPSTWPTSVQLELILVRALRTYARALVVVLVDSASKSWVADFADGVVEVAVRDQAGLLSGSVLVTRRGGRAAQGKSVGFHIEGGHIHWYAGN